MINSVLLGAWPRRQALSLKNMLRCSKTKLMVQERILFKGMKAAIPKSIQQKIFRLLRERHPGILRIKMLARDTLYWYGLNKDIKKMVGIRCKQKTSHTTGQPLEKVWERIHVDFAGPMEESTYLVLAFAYAKWLEVFQMQTTSANNTI